VLAGHGGLTLLEGPGGVGKSTFLELIAEDSALAGFRVASSKASWVEDPPPFRMIGDALKIIAAGPKSTPFPIPSKASSAPLAFQPALEKGAPRFSPTDPLGSMTDDARSELASERLRLLGSLAAPLIVASARSPVLLVLDDVHLADEASQAFLLYLLPHIASLPIWLLASSTPPDGSPSADPDPLATLRARGEVDRITLRSLSEPEVREFVRWLLPQERFPDAEIRRLHTESAGIPPRVVQLLSPSATEATGSEESPAPPLEEEPAVGTLEPEARRVLDLALVAGPEFSVPELAGAAELGEEATIGFLGRFGALGLVHKLEDGRFAFDRDEARDSLYVRLGARQLRLHHQRLAEALIRTGSTDISTVYSLARHTYLGGMDVAAVEYNQRAAAYAAERFQPATSLLYLRLALEAQSRIVPSDPHVELKLQLEIAVQQVHLGEVEAAERSIEEIHSDDRLWTAASPVDRALLGVYRARVMADQGRWDEADRSLQEMPANLRGLEPGTLRRSALRLQGEILFYRGDYTGAVEAHEAALVIAQEEGQASEVAAEEIRRATALSMIPAREWEAIGVYRAAIDRLVELGDLAEAAFGALCLGAQLGAQGHSEEARDALHRSIELSEAAHDVRRAGWAHLNLADLELGLDRTVEASGEVRRARDRFEQVEDTLGSARAALTEGRIALAAHEFGVAERGFETARSIFASRHLTPDELEVDLRSAELAMAREDEAGARRGLLKVLEAGLANLRPDLVEDGRRLGRRLAPPVLDIG
jgi:tetratricopeptide (TPR) repeat protein